MRDLILCTQSSVLTDMMKSVTCCCFNSHRLQLSTQSAHSKDLALSQAVKVSNSRITETSVDSNLKIECTIEGFQLTIEYFDIPTQFFKLTIKGSEPTIECFENTLKLLQTYNQRGQTSIRQWCYCKHCCSVTNWMWYVRH